MRKCCSCALCVAGQGEGDGGDEGEAGGGDEEQEGGGEETGRQCGEGAPPHPEERGPAQGEGLLHQGHPQPQRPSRPGQRTGTRTPMHICTCAVRSFHPKSFHPISFHPIL